METAIGAGDQVIAFAASAGAIRPAPGSGYGQPGASDGGIATDAIRGLVKWPGSLADWGAEFSHLFKQQANQITAPGVMAGLVGLLTTRRYLWLFGPPLLAFTWFGLTYHVADLDSMLIPLT